MSTTIATALEKEKRKIGGDTAEAERNAKRARTQAAMTKHSFQECFLTMLMCLYTNEEDNNTVNPDTWKQVQLFLKQRPLLLRNKKERERLHGIHQEAVDHVKSQNKTQHQASLLLTPRPTPQQLQSPHHPTSSMFSPLTTTSPAATNKQPRRSTLALVARLLGRRAAVRQSEAAHPFASLLIETNSRVQELEGKLQSLRQERLEKDRQRMTQLLSTKHASPSNNNTNDDDNGDYNTIVKVENKIRLWKMLAHALRQVE